MDKPLIRAGIIGLGFVGGGDQVSGDRLGQQVADLDGNHRQALASHPRVTLVAGSSRDDGRRRRFAERTGARTYADWRQMLQAERLDLVSIATATAVHAEQTIACADAGVRAIYCEKPIATRLADAERAIAACRRSGALLVVNHNRRFQPTYRRLAAHVAAGGLGELTGVYLQWSTGRLANVGTHFIDAARMLTGREVRAVSATLDPAGRPDCRGPECRDPGGWALLRMEGGPMTIVNAPDYAAGPCEVVVSGSRGRARIVEPDVQLEYWDGGREAWPAPRGAGTSIDVAVREIVAWLDDGAPCCTTADEALRALEVIVACHASHGRSGTWIELPLAGADREREVLSG
jgi:predicted dehydrogenase